MLLDYILKPKKLLQTAVLASALTFLPQRAYTETYQRGPQWTEDLRNTEEFGPAKPGLERLLYGTEIHANFTLDEDEKRDIMNKVSKELKEKYDKEIKSMEIKDACTTFKHPNQNLFYIFLKDQNNNTISYPASFSLENPTEIYINYRAMHEKAFEVIKILKTPDEQIAKEHKGARERKILLKRQLKDAKVENFSRLEVAAEFARIYTLYLSPMSLKDDLILQERLNLHDKKSGISKEESLHRGLAVATLLGRTLEKLGELYERVHVPQDGISKREQALDRRLLGFYESSAKNPVETVQKEEIQEIIGEYLRQYYKDAEWIISHKEEMERSRKLFNDIMKNHPEEYQKWLDGKIK